MLSGQLFLRSNAIPSAHFTVFFLPDSDYFPHLSGFLHHPARLIQLIIGQREYKRAKKINSSGSRKN